MEGFVNSPDAVKGLEFYKELYKCCTPPGASNVYMAEGPDAFKSGQVALQMNFAFTWPGLYKDPNVGGDKIGFFANPAGEGAFRPARRPGDLGGLLFRPPGRRASSTSSGSSSREVQKKWWALGGYSCALSVLNDPSFVNSAPYAKTFLESMAIVKDFWAEPSYAELLLDMQKRIHDYVVADKGTAKEALDALVKDWRRSSRTKARSVPSVYRFGARAIGRAPGDPPADSDCTVSRSLTAFRAKGSTAVMNDECRNAGSPDRAELAPPGLARRVRGLSDRASPGSSSARPCCCCWRSTSSR